MSNETTGVKLKKKGKKKLARARVLRSARSSALSPVFEPACAGFFLFHASACTRVCVHVAETGTARHFCPENTPHLSGRKMALYFARKKEDQEKETNKRRQQGACFSVVERENGKTVIRRTDLPTEILDY